MTNAEVELREFKERTHALLTGLGIPEDPYPEETKEHGCRMESRFKALKEILGASRKAGVDVATEKDTFYLYWILQAYQSLGRAGWEPGFTHEEMRTKLLNILCNSGIEPNKGPWRELAKKKMGVIPP